MPKVFISHAWDDKPLARRIARRIGHRGLDYWLDESRPLEIGANLPDQLAKAVRSCDSLAVVLTADAAESPWVRAEIDTARKQKMPIIPLLCDDPGASAPVAQEYLGVDLRDELSFEGRLSQVATHLLKRPPSKPNKAMLEKDLAAIIAETPDLEPIITGVRYGPGVTLEQAAAIAAATKMRHAIEFALLTAWDLADNDEKGHIAIVSASIFSYTGAGASVLRAHSEAAPESEKWPYQSFWNSLSSAAGKDAGKIETILRLFESASAPNDLSFAALIRQAFSAFTAEQRERAVAYVVKPKRGPGGGVWESAYDLFKRLPNNPALALLWRSWIITGGFSATREEPQTEGITRLFNLIHEAREADFIEFQSVVETYHAYFKSVTRTPSLKSLNEVTGQLVEARNKRYVFGKALFDLAFTGLRSSEWDGWPGGSYLLETFVDYVHDLHDWSGYMLEFPHDALRRVRSAIETTPPDLN